MEAARAGFDSVVIDFSALPFDENVSRTKETVEAIKAINPAILAEGEIGDIGTGSEIHATVPNESRYLSTPEDSLDNSSTPLESTSLLPRSVTCMACWKAWSKGKQKST